MKRQRRFGLLLLLFLLTMNISFVYATVREETRKVELGDGSTTDAYFFASTVAGISWWDKCDTEFYFVKEKNNTMSYAEEDAILATFPTCRTYLTKNEKPASEKTFSTAVRSYSYSKTVFMSYGTTLEVSIPKLNGIQTYRYMSTY